MTDDRRADYLAGESDGLDLAADERTALDRVLGHLADEAMWVDPPPDGQFRLLAAATAEAATGPSGDGDTTIDVTASGAPVAPIRPERPLPSTGDGQAPAAPTPPQRPAIGGDPASGIGDDETAEAVRSIEPSTETGGVLESSTGRGDAEAGTDAGAVDELAARRADQGRTAAWFGAGALAAAAALVIGFIVVDRLGSDEDGIDLSEEVAVVVATYDLTATDLDPDATAEVDVKPTVAGVEFELRLMGLDNAEGDDYYSAWLVGGDEAIPLGSFHWRAGGVPIILWSGVDDGAYDRLMITRQSRGDGGTPSGEVVLMGMIPDLTGDGTG